MDIVELHVSQVNWIVPLALLVWMVTKKALEEMHIAYDPQCLVEADFECDSAIAATKSFSPCLKSPPQFFVLTTLWRSLLSAPFDNMAFKSQKTFLSWDTTTSIFQLFFLRPLQRFISLKNVSGKMAVELLLERIQHQSNQHQVIEIKPELVLRKSVKTIHP